MPSTYAELRRQMSMAGKTDPGGVLVRALMNVVDTVQNPNPKYIRASSMHLGARQLAYIYSMTPPDKARFTARTRRILRHGTAMHTKFQEELAQTTDADLELIETEREVKSDEFRLIGHIDAVVAVRGKHYFVEYKSIHSAQWGMMKSPLPRHNWQAASYAVMTGLPGILVYDNKDSQELKTFLWSLTDEWRGKVIQKVKDAFSAVEGGAVLPLCEEGCSQCPFHATCVADRKKQGLPLEDPEKVSA